MKNKQNKTKTTIALQIDLNIYRCIKCLQVHVFHIALAHDELMPIEQLYIVQFTIFIEWGNTGERRREREREKKIKK